MIDLTPEQWHVHQQLVHDYEFFARHIQKIEPKDLEEQHEGFFEQLEALKGEDSTAGMIPLIFQPGQAKFHRFVTEMKQRRGIVRAALVKPRQVGWSTIIQGRAHWLATKTPGFKVHIVSHTSDSTHKFLRRARKMVLAAPPTVTPGRQVENSKELVFNNGATYGIATAGTPAAMRSDSCHFFHGSEIPYWPAMGETLGAVLPALSDGIGSEGYLESSSKGKGNPWHHFILDVIAGETEWEIFFDAYFNHPRYRMTPPPDWEPNDEAKEHQIEFGLSIEQIYWRAMKIKSLRALWLFKQEFPSTIEESFQASEDTLIQPDAVNKARYNGKNGLIAVDPFAPLIMGVDPARNGDRTCIAFRQGNVLLEVKTYTKMEDMRLVGIIAKFLQEGRRGKKIAKCFIDYAIGEGAASRLRELNFGREVEVVHFGEKAAEERSANKRAEMYVDMRDWFGDTGEYVSIPDSDDIVADLLATPDFLQSTGSEKIKLVPKEVIKKDYGRSPDIADSIALTFAWPVRGEQVAELQKFAKQNFTHLPPSELASVLRDFDRA